MSKYHIRYGGYGGIGYYLVSDNYIALSVRPASRRVNAKALTFSCTAAAPKFSAKVSAPKR
jgi:hypothetical protein